MTLPLKNFTPLPSDRPLTVDELRAVFGGDVAGVIREMAKIARHSQITPEMAGGEPCGKTR